MSPQSAIKKEKELKGWLRAKKIALIEESNSTWEDLSAPWYKAERQTFPPANPRSPDKK